MAILIGPLISYGGICLMRKKGVVANIKKKTYIVYSEITALCCPMQVWIQIAALCGPKQQVQRMARPSVSIIHYSKRFHSLQRFSCAHQN